MGDCFAQEFDRLTIAADVLIQRQDLHLDVGQCVPIRSIKHYPLTVRITSLRLR